MKALSFIYSVKPLTYFLSLHVLELKGWTKAIAGENLSIYYNTATKNEVMRMINLVFSDMHEVYKLIFV